MDDVSFALPDRPAPARHAFRGMTVFGLPWGIVEMEPEVADWLVDLASTDPDAFGRAEFYIDLLEDRGSGLGFPYTSQLDGKLRELRFHLRETPCRMTYFIATGRRIILLTVFSKGRRHERTEMERAGSAMRTCIAKRHPPVDEAP